jgi:hypothetical protein
VRIKFILRRLVARPMRRLGRTVINLVIFDIASAVYWYAKNWFREPRTKGSKEEDADMDIGLSDLKSRRRW